MNVNKKISLGLVLLTSAANIMVAKDKKRDEYPNIVWITSEDNSPYIGIYGDKVVRTPNIDNLAKSGVVYSKVFANAPVSAPARNTLITGMFANSNGNHNMRSYYKLPDMVRFFPEYLREAGYYTTNCDKEDYNTSSKRSNLAWDESSVTASYKNRRPGQPFFHVKNIGTTHESSLFDSLPGNELGYNPDDMKVYPYHPNTPTFRHVYAQYYTRMTSLDKQVGEIIDDLKSEGLFENTIIFYFSDHGGVLPRSKRFLFESGTWVPLVIHVPEKFKHLVPEKTGKRSDRIISFVDFAPSVLALVGIDKPQFMQGQVFLGQKVPKSKSYAFSFRGRMDEKNDLMYSARDKQYRYIRNYYPERIYGQHLDYLWRNRSAGEWERLFFEGKLNEVQSAFWKTKPYEELYDVTADPHNIRNLAANPRYRKILQRMSEATNQWIEQTLPLDVIPEIMLLEIDRRHSLTDSLKGENFPLLKVHQIARMSAKADKADFDKLYSLTKDKNPALAFWALKSMYRYQNELEKSGLMHDFKMNLHHSEVYFQVLTANVLVSFGLNKGLKDVVLRGVNARSALTRSEALQLYMQLERDAEIDKRIKERYEGEKLDGPGNERNTFNNLYRIIQ